MCANPLFLSNNYIDRALREDIQLSPMKLQKLLYFTYRDYLKECGKSLFSERFGTWQYGPVLESVYHEFKHYGSNSISNYDAMLNDATGEVEAFMVNERDNPKLTEIINNIWAKCRHKNGIELSQLTHLEGSAWYKAFQEDKAFLEDADIKSDNIQIA